MSCLPSGGFFCRIAEGTPQVRLRYALHLEFKNRGCATLRAGGALSSMELKQKTPKHYRRARKFDVISDTVHSHSGAMVLAWRYPSWGL